MENYFKDVRKSIFYIEWTPFSVITILLLTAYKSNTEASL